jgi:peptidylprolyl isomerase
VLLVVLGIAGFILFNRSGDIPAAATGDNPTATITTPRGEIVIRLLPDIAPQTVENFVTLANDGFYDGLTWHRVIEGFMAQGGDPAGDGSGGPGYTIPAEFTNEIQFDRPGIVAMARRGNDINSAGSQFFITTAPAPHLNSQYTIFGEVIEGQDVVNDIPLRDPMTATEPGEEIISITIEDATESGEAQTQ